jgi:diguanylate cyclase (GGDEF)-like protein/PAS domain S-box-containing protein
VALAIDLPARVAEKRMDPLGGHGEGSGGTGAEFSVPSTLARLVGERTEALQREIGQLRERAVQMQRIYDQSALLIGTLALHDDALFLLTGSAALANLLGAARVDLAARPLSDFGIAGAAAQRWLDACRDAERLALPQRFELSFVRSGAQRSFAGLTGTLNGTGGARTFWFTLDETTASRAAEAAAAERERLVETLIEGAPVGVQLFDRSGVSLRMNEVQRALFGLPEIPPAQLERAGSPPGGTPAQTLVLERRFFPLADRAGAVRTVVAFTADISGRGETGTAHAAEVQRLAQLAETMAEGLVAMDSAGDMIYANAAAERLLGAGARPANADSSLPRWRRPSLKAEAFAAIEQGFHSVREAGAAVRDIEFTVEQPDGHTLTLSASIAPLRARDGAFDGAVAVLNDITARRTVEEALRAEAIRDQLTGLYNRRYMEESLRREIHSAARRGSPLTVVMLDIDNFKHFNDDYGHAAGDLMLRSIGAYLQQHIRAGDIACRYGGEELTLIFPDTSIEDTRRRVDGLRQQLGALRVSYRDSELAGVAISAGIAGMPAHGDSPEALLRVADAALYRAKTLGRDRVVIGDL